MASEKQGQMLNEAGIIHTCYSRTIHSASCRLGMIKKVQCLVVNLVFLLHNYYCLILPQSSQSIMRMV